MLITTDVEITLNPNNIKYYESLGYIIPKVKDKWRRYKTPKGTKILVKVEDLPKGTDAKVNVLCDFCLDNGIETIVEKSWRNYLKSNINGIIHKDCCDNCKGKKIEESNLQIYNVNHISKLDNVKSKLEEHYNIIRVQSYNLIRKEFENRNYKLLTCIDDYKNSYSILKFICNKHPKEIQTTYWHTFRDNKHNCKFCLSEYRSELVKYTLEDAKQIFLSHGFILLAEKFGTVKTELPFVCLKHPENIQYTTLDYILRYGQSCKICRYDKTRGENNCNWKGGISQLNDYLRTCISDWKTSSFKNGNYKCVLTSSEKNLIIHHLYGFDLIIKELIDITGFPIKQFVNEYSEIELQIMKDVIIKLHNKYGYGVVLSNEVHKLFHSIYGYGNNTSEQFEEFSEKHNNGEFNNLLKIA